MSSLAVKKLNKYLKENKLSLRKAANLIGIHFTNLYYIKSGRHLPTLRTINKINKLTKINLKDWGV